MNLVVSDASPINYLVLIQAIDFLPKLFSKVLLPRVVWEQELQHHDTPEPVRIWVQRPPHWLEVKEPSAVPDLNLHPGETHAIALALELKCPVLLDEREARTIARRNGLQVLGTIGLLEQAASKDLVDLPKALERLGRTNARISPSIIQEALARERERKSRQQ